MKILGDRLSSLHLCHLQSSDRNGASTSTSVSLFPPSAGSKTERQEQVPGKEGPCRSCLTTPCPYARSACGSHPFCLGGALIFLYYFFLARVGPALSRQGLSHSPGRRTGKGCASPQSQGTYPGCRTLAAHTQTGQAFFQVSTAGSPWVWGWARGILKVCGELLSNS